MRRRDRTFHLGGRCRRRSPPLSPHRALSCYLLIGHWAQTAIPKFHRRIWRPRARTALPKIPPSSENQLEIRVKLAPTVAEQPSRPGHETRAIEKDWAEGKHNMREPLIAIQVRKTPLRRRCSKMSKRDKERERRSGKRGRNVEWNNGQRRRQTEEPKATNCHRYSD